MITYPKIDTLYARDPATFRVNPAQLRRPEFGLINRWRVVEKIDGMNIRVGWKDGRVTFGGRSDRADIPQRLFFHLVATFREDNLVSCFDLQPGQEVVLFGEGYGEKIRGNPLNSVGVVFRLFDVWVNGFWLEPDDISDVARKLGVPEAPYLGELTGLPDSAAAVEQITGFFSLAAWEDSSYAKGGPPGHSPSSEGIIARAVPGLFDRHGRRLMWKLKFTDFAV